MRTASDLLRTPWLTSCSSKILTVLAGRLPADHNDDGNYRNGLEGVHKPLLCVFADYADCVDCDGCKENEMLIMMTMAITEMVLRVGTSHSSV